MRTVRVTANRLLSGNCRRTVGELSGNCLGTVGELSARNSSPAGLRQLPENCRRTVGELSGDCRGTVGELSVGEPCGASHSPRHAPATRERRLSPKRRIPRSRVPRARYVAHAHVIPHIKMFIMVRLRAACNHICDMTPAAGRSGSTLQVNQAQRRRRQQMKAGGNARRVRRHHRALADRGRQWSRENGRVC